MLVVLCGMIGSFAQEDRLRRMEMDSVFIDQVENAEEPDKVLHAEPLYVDLIRDLGARKGEKEWNLGFGILDKLENDEIEALVEYEFAPVNRLGVEFELPFVFFTGDLSDQNRLKSIQVAAQYTFLVSLKSSISLALGYIHEFKLIPFDSYGDEPLYTGNEFNPFFVAAKRFGSHFHTLIYTGPSIERKFNSGMSETTFEINTNLHYMIPGSSNFIGIEFNKEIEDGDFDMTIRPQMRVEVTEQILMGLVTGIAVNRENERLSMFFRLIYEPD